MRNLRRKAEMVKANPLLSQMFSVRQSYEEIELTELMCLQAFSNGFAAPEHWNHLAECRNVLLIGAGHKVVESQKAGRDASQYLAIIDLCRKGSAAMLAIRNRERETGSLSISDDELEVISGILATSAEFWPLQPNTLFADVVQYVRGLVHYDIRPKS